MVSDDVGRIVGVECVSNYISFFVILFVTIVFKNIRIFRTVRRCGKPYGILFLQSGGRISHDLSLRRRLLCWTSTLGSSV